jgi:DNA-binding transcriptional LysR family regulator
MLELRRLRLFTIVAEEGSFTAAAHRLHLTQSAVSQQMSVLEHEIGITLVQRSSRGINLTPAGQVLVARALRLFTELSAIEREICRLGGNHDGTAERRSRTHIRSGGR